MFGLISPAILLTALSAAAWAGQVSGNSPARTEVHTLTGLVVDSIRGRPLAGAEVVISGTTLSVTTDSTGRFTFDSLSAGDYRLAFFHPFLDSISVASASVAFTVPFEEREEIVLAIPSTSSLIRAICQVDSAEGRSILVGRVRDPETGAPTPGASVFVLWTDFEVLKDKSLKRIPQTMQGAADATGAYRVCGVPDEVDAVVYATLDSATTARVPVSSKASTVLIRDLALAAPASATAGRTASIAGRVRNGDGAPVSGAKVTLDGTSRAVNTNSAGDFSLSGLPLGTQSVTVRRIGFAPVTIPVELTSQGIHRVDAVITEAALVLDPKVVIAQRDRALANVGFTRRRKTGVGDYRTRADFERDNPIYLSDVLARMRGLRMDIANGQRVMRSAGQGTDCVHVVVDNVPFEPLFPGELDDAVLPQHISAIEVYSGGSVPPEFEGVLARGCTTVVIWTRTRVKDFVK
jgi:hypothetical protein